MGAKTKRKQRQLMPSFARRANSGQIADWATSKASWTIEQHGESTWGDSEIVHIPLATGDNWDTMAPSTDISPHDTTTVDFDTKARAQMDCKLSCWPQKNSITIVRIRT